MNRIDFLHHVRDTLGSVKTAVEVGVWRGDYSLIINQILQPQQFWGVDPYRLHEDYGDCPDPVEFANQTNLDQLYEMVETRYGQWSNSTLLRQRGTDAAQHFEDASLDFVYIDGDHSYSFVQGDIAAWWPKIRPGGILSGHDYCMGNPQKGHVYGVMQAVDEHAALHNLTLSTTQEDYATWWVTK